MFGEWDLAEVGVCDDERPDTALILKRQSLHEKRRGKPAARFPNLHENNKKRTENTEKKCRGVSYAAKRHPSTALHNGRTLRSHASFGFAPVITKKKKKNLRSRGGFNRRPGLRAPSGGTVNPTTRLVARRLHLLQPRNSAKRSEPRLLQTADCSN